jgi:hypothetical protein
MFTSIIKNIKHMTNEVSKMWSELVDANWELSHNPSPEAITRYVNAEVTLRREIGDDEYRRFIRMGQQMFGV